MIKGKLVRDERIHLKPKSDKAFQVTNNDGETLLDESDDFYIYFSAVNFRNDGKIDGKYMGENPTTIIDKYCQPATFTDDKGWMLPDGVRLRTARLVAVENKTGVIVIIQGI